MAPKRQKHTIIFVCFSNTCRSPMAEYLLRNKLETNGLGEKFRVVSRGLSDTVDPLNSHASFQGQKVRT